LSLLITLPIGILAVVLCYFVLLRFVTRQPLKTGFVTAVLTTTVYVAFAIRYWPGGDVFAVHIALFLITVYILTITSHQRRASGQTDFRLHWAPATIIGFFVVIVSFDSVFIVLAQRGVGPDWARRILPTPRSGGAVESRFPGIISHDFHEREEAFNAYQAEREQQRALGWQSHLGWEQTATMNQNNRLMLSLKDAQHQAIADATISGRFLYPGNAKLDQVFSMRAVGGGLYDANLNFSRAGTWDLVLTISRNADKLELRTTTTIENPQSRHD
jgi:nitrogen fixation protein FixH